MRLHKELPENWTPATQEEASTLKEKWKISVKRARQAAVNMCIATNGSEISGAINRLKFAALILTFLALPVNSLQAQNLYLAKSEGSSSGGCCGCICIMLCILGVQQLYAQNCTNRTAYKVQKVNYRKKGPCDCK
jgi:hypothetical protein